MRILELAKKFNLKENQKITFLTVPEWKPYFQLSLVEKITASIRKEVSRRLYQYFGIRKPIKKFIKVDEQNYLAVQDGIVCEIHWNIYYPSVYIETRYPFSREEKSFPDPNYPAYYEPQISIRRLDPTNYSDVGHPLHSWFSRGASDGYGDGYWDRSEDADYSEPPDFPSEDAKTAYELGYETGHTNGMMDE
jgi:hypothetical protein